MSKYKVRAKSKRFGRCLLTFVGPTGSSHDTNHLIYNSKDPDRYVRIWFYPKTKKWACEIHTPKGYQTFGTAWWDTDHHFRTPEQAWVFISTKIWS